MDETVVSTLLKQMAKRHAAELDEVTEQINQLMERGPQGRMVSVPAELLELLYFSNKRMRIHIIGALSSLDMVLKATFPEGVHVIENVIDGIETGDFTSDILGAILEELHCEDTTTEDEDEGDE